MSAIFKKRKVSHQASSDAAALLKKSKKSKRDGVKDSDRSKASVKKQKSKLLKEPVEEQVGEQNIDEDGNTPAAEEVEANDGAFKRLEGVALEEGKKEDAQNKEEKTNGKKVKGEAGEGVKDDTTETKPVPREETKGDSSTSAEMDVKEAKKTFADLGVMPALVEACTSLNYKYPTPIQVESIPLALQGRDLIALAETGSGKTAAFALPILQALWDNPRPLFACILAPTRELAFQISEAFDALGGGIGVKTAVVVGGMDMTPQAIALGKRPHIIVATPGRLLDHLENTKGFSLRGLKYLVMDEADKLLDLDFGPSIDKILKVIPNERRTYLFSATMTSKVEKLQRASLSNPLRVQVSSKYQTVKTLLQYYMLFPFKHKDTYLVWLVNEFAGQSIIIFTRTVNETQRLAILLRCLGFAAVPLHGQLSQSARLGALTKFKSGSRNILVATDVAARGLDIPCVDCVLNYDLAQDSKTYIHRVGRTARAGRAGKSISLTTQYDVELLVRIEAALGKKLDEYPSEKEEVLLLSERVGEAQREAIRQMKEMAEKKGRKSGGGGRKGNKERGYNDREEE